MSASDPEPLSDGGDDLAAALRDAQALVPSDAEIREVAERLHDLIGPDPGSGGPAGGDSPLVEGSIAKGVTAAVLLLGLGGLGLGLGWLASGGAEEPTDADEATAVTRSPPVDTALADMHAADLAQGDVAPAEEAPADTDPVETDPVETDPVETDPVETDPVETDPVETDPVETDPVETEPVDPTPSTFALPTAHARQEPPTAETGTTPTEARPADSEPVPEAEPGASPEPEVDSRPTELQLLSRARAALRSEPARALALAEEHRGAYPAGVLAQEREVIAIEALTRLGRRPDAERRAAHFRRRWSSSVHEPRISAILEP